MCFFDAPIKSKKVRKNLFAYLYPNGVVNIDGIKYVGYSLSYAIRIHRQKYPKYSRG